MRWTIFTTLMLVGASMAGCATDESTENGNETDGTNATNGTGTPTPANATGNASVPTLRVVARQSAPPGNGTTYSFDAPSSVPAGWVKLVVENRGDEPHQATVLALGNMTMDDMAAAMSGEGNASSGTPRLQGGVGGALPGQNTTVWLRLEPGRHVLVCFIPDPVTGMPHAMHGMMRELQVTNGTGAARPPAADLRITLDDHEFRPDRNVTAGRHVVEVRNEGALHHEAVYFRLAPGATLDEALASFGPNATGPPPIVEMGGVAIMEPGATNLFEADFVPGHYAMLCFEQGEGEPAPHFALGMVWEFNVTR